ncbi:L,D-transpeptidase family protein [Pedobacter sp. LMG 31464]|uniref:L,D-transpeptidase family protein n=1 Tax=Pedobacter planticolens TaxID=2679964 RepID=A0A923DUT2_9SPHI|nr:L,D-transpeptidase family protein [Pedobacter planticolens]MBB2144272.1 L,D-transpeptidase family protein [Pedobacter planticolens]
MKKTLLFLALCLFLSSCGWFNKQPEIATVLAKHFDNKLYKKFDTVAYDLIFSKKMDEVRHNLSNPKVTKAFYAAHKNNPILITRFYTNGGIDTLESYLKGSKADGFNPEIFHLNELTGLLKTLDSNKFKNIEEVYPVIAELEIKTADALLKYSSFIKYGSVNPLRLFNRYSIAVKRPDSLKLDSVLNTEDLVSVLKNAQPTSKSYVDLKRELAVYRDNLKSENDPAIRIIKLNMERLRWQLPIQTDEVVMVNIPDFSLTWFNKSDTLTHMNVCVGGKREEGYAEKMKAYLKSGNLDDKPKNHETPQLVSVFNAIQVNPIWNIPVSIAQSEIYWQARKDPYYLSNNNIKVYMRGKQVYDPDTIQWDQYPREKLPFEFKQGSGEGNALGKFKFIFDNSSSIYLHDTNNKRGFKLANRAISHGCVRIEKPLEFAQLMVRNKSQYDDLRMDVNLPPVDTTRMPQFKKKQAKRIDTLNVFQLKPTWFATRKKVSVVISYYTAWAENGKVQFRPDVYNYDGILWDAIKKYM